MTDIPRDFKGIWIPREIWLSDKLTCREKFLLAEIDSLDGDAGCFASNSYFAKIMQCTVPYVSQMISNLTDLQMVTVDESQKRRVLHSNLRKLFFFPVAPVQQEQPLFGSEEGKDADPELPYALTVKLPPSHNTMAFKKALLNYYAMRKLKRAPMTLESKTEMIETKLLCHPVEHAIKLLKNAATKSHMDIFPLPEPFDKKGTPSKPFTGGIKRHMHAQQGR